jgi:hypothetical protein
MMKGFSNFKQEAWVPYFIKRLCDIYERRRVVLFPSMVPHKIYVNWATKWKIM